MSRQRAAVHELQKFRQCLLELGRILEHVVGDACQADDLRCEASVGVDEGLEPLGDLAVAQHHCANLRDGLPVHLEAGGLDIEAHELIVQGAVLLAVDSYPVIQVVDKVPLHAVENFDLVPGGMPGVREGLGHAMVGDGDGGMPPADGRLDGVLGVRQGVHVAHLRVQVQLHPFFRGGVLTFGVVDHVDVVRIELNILAVPGGLHLALDAQPHARLDGGAVLFRLLGGEVFMDTDGVGVVRHVEVQPPHAGAACLHTLGGKDLAGHGGGAHFQVQLPHGIGAALDGFTQQHLGYTASLLVLSGGRG